MNFKVYKIKIGLILILCTGLISGPVFAQFEQPPLYMNGDRSFEYLFECQAGEEGAPECHEILDIEARLEQEDRLLIVPFAIKYNEDTVTILSAQIRVQRRGRTRLKESLNRNIKGIVREYGSGFPHLPLGSENVEGCNPTCPEQEFLLKMRQRGYGNIFVSVTDYDGSDGHLRMKLSTTILTPNMMYSGIIPELDANGHPIIRSGNIGTWFTISGMGKMVQRAAFTTIQNPASRTTPFALLVHFVASLGIGVLSSIKTVDEIHTLNDNLRGLRYSNAQGHWIGYDSFYKVNFGWRKNRNRVFLDESSYSQ